MMDRKSLCTTTATLCVAAAALTIGGGNAHAQDNWDGNIVFGNFSGEYDATADCDATLYRDHGALNDEVDPMLTDPFAVPPASGFGAVPNFVPMPGSPAIGTNDDVSRIAFGGDTCSGSNDENCSADCTGQIVAQCWRGGMPPATYGPDWTLGWTYYNRDGAGGQLDVLLWPFFKRDLAEGRLDEETAVFYLACLLLNDPQYYQIGGPDSEGRDQTNRLSFLILEAGHRLKASCNVTIRGSAAISLTKLPNS